MAVPGVPSLGPVSSTFLFGDQQVTGLVEAGYEPRHLDRDTGTTKAQLNPAVPPMPTPGLRLTSLLKI